jgi:hypothetical protein
VDAISPSNSNVLDWEGLKEAAEFDPTYLHLETDEAAV